MAQYRYFSEGQLKEDPTTGTKCRTGQLNHQFVEQKFVGGVWVGIGDNDGVRYGDVAGAGCRFREGMRDGDYAVDMETEVAGFLLAEGDGWVNCGSVSGYWMPSKQLAGESVNFWAKGRNGLTMPDTIASNDVQILTPTFRGGPNAQSLTAPGGVLERVFDGGSYIIYVKFKQLAAQTTTNYVFWMGSDGAVERGLICYVSANVLRLVGGDGTNSFNTVLIADVATTLQNAGWVEMFVEVDFATKRLRTHIYKISDGSNIGTNANIDISTWTFNNNDNGPTYPNLKFSAIVFAWADFKKFNVLKTIIQCRDNAYVTDLQFYYPTLLDGTDVSGNAHHILRPSAADLAYVPKAMTEFNNYYSEISTYCLDYGYSLYRSDSHDAKYANWPTITPGYMDIYVPNDIFGISILRTFLDAADQPYIKMFECAGNLTKHNLADSLLAIPSWDKSNVTIFKDSLRISPYYDVSNPTRWHPEELNLDKLLSFVNTGYEGMFFMKIEDTSAYDRKFLTELFSFNTNKIGSDFKTIIHYTKDDDWYHTIDYYFSDISIRAQRDNKVLAFDFATKILSLSLDGGITYLITKDLTGVLSTDGGQPSPVNDAYIYANGNITFGDNHKQYLSTDNLSTYAQTTVLDVDGNPYVSINTFDDFKPVVTNYFSYLADGTEIRLWGNYQYDSPEANIWFTKDSGVTIKSIYRRVGGITHPYTHVHAVNWDYVHNTVWIQFGDNTSSLVVKGVYNLITDTWTFTDVGTGDAYYRITGMAFYGSKVIYAGDTPTGNEAYQIWQIDYNDLDDFTKRKRANYLHNYLPNNTVCLFGEPDGQVITSILNREKAVFTSINQGKYFIKHTLIGGPGLTGASNGYYNFLPKNTNRYFRADIFSDTEEIGNGFNWEKGPVLMVRILRANEIATPL